MTERGYHATTTPEIARRAGVAEGTIYRHFESKQGLLNEIYRAGVGVFAEAFAAAARAPTTEDRLGAAARGWCDIAARDASLARLVILMDWGPELDGRSRDIQRDLRDRVEQVVAGGKSAGDIRPGPAATSAAIWFALIRYAIGETAAGRWKPGEAGIVIDAAWDAIRARSDAGHPPSSL